MSLPRFFVETPLDLGAAACLDPEQSRQVRSTLRLRPGDEIVVFDGSGAEGVAALTAIQKESVAYEVRAIEHPQREPVLRLRVGLALLRGERFDLAVQKLTELGVSRITPLTAERCVVSFPVAADWERRAGRLLRVAREAAEQSERVTVPLLDAPITPAALLQDGPLISLVERADATPLSAVALAGQLTIAIGPEGGWAPRELAQFRAAQVNEASLGRLILRAETAAIVAAGTLLQRGWHELQ